MKISIVIVTYNSEQEIDQVIKSIFSAVKAMDFEIIIVDNNSKDSTVSKVKGISSDIRLIRNQKNLGFASANNQAFRVATGDFVLILNPDIVLTDQTKLEELCTRLLESGEIGIIAPRLDYPNGRIQESVRGYPNFWIQLVRVLRLDDAFKWTKQYQRYMNANSSGDREIFVDWVIGAFMLIRKDLLFEIGLFDQRYFMYMEDADLCLCLKKKGYKICYAPQFSAVHTYKRESAKRFISTLKLMHVASSIKFYLKHGLTRFENEL